MNPVTLMPEDEKHTLLESIETEAEGEEKKPWIRIDLAVPFIFNLLLFIL